MMRQAQTMNILSPLHGRRKPQPNASLTRSAFSSSPQPSFQLHTRPNMNWTGGSLQRTKQANKGVLQKQKAFFARTRTHLQNGPKSPAAPFRPTYLQNDDSLELAGHLPALGSSSVRHIGQSAWHHHEPAHCRTPLAVTKLHYEEDLLPAPATHRQLSSRGPDCDVRGVLASCHYYTWLWICGGCSCILTL